MYQGLYYNLVPESFQKFFEPLYLIVVFSHFRIMILKSQYRLLFSFGSLL